MPRHVFQTAQLQAVGFGQCRFDLSATTNRFGQHGRWRQRPPPSNGSLPRSCHDTRAPLLRRLRWPRLRRRALARWRRMERGRPGYKSHHGGVPPRPPVPGNLPGPVAGHPTYGRRPGHRTAIARRGAGGEGPGGGFPGPSCFSPSGAGTAVGGLPSRAWLPLRPHPAGSVLRLDSLRGRLWRHPGPQFMTVGSFAFAQRPLHAPPPPDKVLLCSFVCHWLRCACGSRGAETRDAGQRLLAANEVYVMMLWSSKVCRSVCALVVWDGCMAPSWCLSKWMLHHRACWFKHSESAQGTRTRTSTTQALS